MILADQLGPEILTMLQNKRTSFASCACNVPGWFSDLNALLTRKLLLFFSRLNELGGGRGNMFLVLGSLPRTLKFLIVTFLTARFGGW